MGLEYKDGMLDVSFTLMLSRAAMVCGGILSGVVLASELPESYLNSLGMKMIRVDKGEIGELETRKDGEFKSIVIAEAFALAEMETTIGQWRSLIKLAPPDAGDMEHSGKAPELPVGGVSYEAAEEFCRKLTERERQSGALPAGYVYQLPTEEMWEYACRAGSKGDFSLPVERIANHFWVGKDDAEVMTARQLEPNPWGFRHMHGNLLEWCRPGADKIGKLEPFLDQGLSHPQRGGCLRFNAEGCRSGARRFGPPAAGQPMHGFRIALVKAPVE